MAILGTSNSVDRAKRDEAEKVWRDGPIGADVPPAFDSAELARQFGVRACPLFVFVHTRHIFEETESGACETSWRLALE